ncbi:MAG: lysophospholipid acyltransferase family protein [Pirellulales bacterium]
MGRRRGIPPFLMGLCGFVSAQSIRAWMSTLDYRAVFYDRSVDPVLGVGSPRIYVFWHENILTPLYVRGHCHLAMLLSQHRDAEILAQVANQMGFDCVRGSTYRGGAKAIWELWDRSRRQHLTITPDGPRGPRRQMALGPIFLASRLGLPLVPMGFGYDRPWRMNSWDHFAVPRPFSRARALIGPPLRLPPDLDRSGLERSRQRTERLLNDLTTEAEAWAAAGTRKAGEIVLGPRAAPPIRRTSAGADADLRSNMQRAA